MKSGLVGMLCRNTRKMTVTSETESRGKQGLEIDDWNRITIKLLQSSTIVKGSLLLGCKLALLKCEGNMFLKISAICGCVLYARKQDIHLLLTHVLVAVVLCTLFFCTRCSDNVCDFNDLNCNVA